MIHLYIPGSFGLFDTPQWHNMLSRGPGIPDLWMYPIAGCQVAEDMYLEPTTGRIYSVARCPYLKIDLIWNHRNLWVNMQAPAGMMFFVQMMRWCNCNATKISNVPQISRISGQMASLRCGGSSSKRSKLSPCRRSYAKMEGYPHGVPFCIWDSSDIFRHDCREPTVVSTLWILCFSPLTEGRERKLKLKLGPTAFWYFVTRLDIQISPTKQLETCCPALEALQFYQGISMHFHYP